MNRRGARPALAGASWLWLACASAAAATPSEQVSYRCARQLQVVALYDNSAAEPGRALAWVHDGTQTHRLSLQRSASGVRYTDGLWTWSGKGGEARLERKGKPTLAGCRAEQTRRVLIDRRTRTQWLLPPSWSAQRVDETLLLGAAAEAEQPGAQVLARYRTRPQPGSPETRELAQLMVFEAPRWEALAQTPGSEPPGELVMRTPMWSYVVKLPPGTASAASTTPAASEPAAALAVPASVPEPQAPPALGDDLKTAVESLRAGLQLWGRGPLLDPCHVSGSVSYRERMALLPADELLVQLLDISRADETPRVLAEHKRKVGAAQVPLRFELACGEPLADHAADARLVVQAHIERDGQLLFAAETPQPVLTQGHGREANLLLTRKRDKPARPSREISR